MAAGELWFLGQLDQRRHRPVGGRHRVWRVEPRPIPCDLSPFHRRRVLARERRGSVRCLTSSSIALHTSYTAQSRLVLRSRGCLLWQFHKVAYPNMGQAIELVGETSVHYGYYMFTSRSFFLLVVSNRETLEWILSEQRIVLPSPTPYAVPDTLMQDDRLVLYTAKGCFRNPTQDRGRVIGTATITSRTRALQSAVVFEDQVFDWECTLRIERLVPADRGPELEHLVGRLSTFPDSWHSHIRRVLVPLNEQDFMVLDESLAEADVGRDAALPSYLNRIRTPESRPIPEHDG